LLRLATTIILVGALAALLVVVPKWTAGKVEAKREADFRIAASRALPSSLPHCPFPGPERDAFLDKSALTLPGTSDLWRPVCRVAPLPDHRIIILTKSRPELHDCSAGDPWRPSNVICVLEERLGFLFDSRAQRSRARREDKELIWVTSQSMAWENHLVSEHRNWMLLAFLMFATAALFSFAAVRTRQAFAWRAACHLSDAPDVPRRAELLLHWVIGRRCSSLPGDLSEEYTWKIENGCSRKEADLWYRWQVFQSVAPVLSRRAEKVLTGGFWRGRFTR
jgi:hypothetical protein